MVRTSSQPAACAGRPETRAIFERYNITSPHDLRDAARRLDAYAVR